MSPQRVVVTGIGLISPLALNTKEHFARLTAGDSAIGALDDEDYKNYPPLAQARVHGFDRRQSVPDRMLRKLLSMGSAYALAGATEALLDSGVGTAELTECGLYVGSVCLEVSPETFIPALKESVNKQNQVDLSCFVRHGMKLIDPLFLVKSLPNAGLCAIAIQHQILGPNANITNGTVSGIQAVIAGSEAILRGDVQVALAGGYDSLLQMDCVVDHLLAGRLCHWDESPTEHGALPGIKGEGYALSEGAAFLMLESLGHARDRKAQIYGEVVSSAQSTSGRAFVDPRNPSSETLTAAVIRALDSGMTSSDEVDLLLGDGLGVESDDTREVEVYREVLGRSKTPFTAFTGAFGFVGAASGAFSLAHAFLAMRHGLLPPFANCPEIFVRYGVPHVRVAQSVSMKKALVWSSDRGIKNAAVVVSSYQGC